MRNNDFPIALGLIIGAVVFGELLVAGLITGLLFLGALLGAP